MNETLIARAAEGVLPDWACAREKRRAHIERVATLLGGWARTLAPDQVARWRAAGWLHDVLRDADPPSLREMLGDAYAGWPDRLLHAPAAALRLRAEGVTDEPLLTAIAYHPIGHPAFDVLGRALYVADYIEPGRTFAPEWCAQLRERMPLALHDVVIEVAAARIGQLLQKKTPLREETAAFWNALVTV